MFTDSITMYQPVCERLSDERQALVGFREVKRVIFDQELRFQTQN